MRWLVLLLLISSCREEVPSASHEGSDPVPPIPVEQPHIHGPGGHTHADSEVEHGWVLDYLGTPFEMEAGQRALNPVQAREVAELLLEVQAPESFDDLAGLNSYLMSIQIPGVPSASGPIQGAEQGHYFAVDVPGRVASRVWVFDEFQRREDFLVEGESCVSLLVSLHDGKVSCVGNFGNGTVYR